MQDPKTVRFITTNLCQLQGLRILPIGVYVILIVVWTLQQVDHRRTLEIPLIIFGLAALACWLIDRYYTRNFGRVKQTRRLMWKEIILMTLGAILGLAGFWVDTTFRLPFSMVGLVIVAGMFADYFRVNWRANWQDLWFYPALGLVILAINLLPLVLGTSFWPAMGIRSALLGMLLVVGVAMILIGLLSHLYLKRNLPPATALQP